MKNKNINVLIIFLSVLYNYSNAQSWQWAKQLGSPLFDDASTVHISSKNNIYVTGNFAGSLFNYGNNSVICNGINDFFIAKYNLVGNLLWFKQLGGNNTGTNCFEGIGGFVLDDNENLYITGAFCHNTTIGSFNFVGTGDEFYIAKFDSSGNCIWAKQGGGNGDDGASGICIDSLGYLYVCGTNSDTATFGINTIAPGGYIAKYDSAGNCIWAKKTFEPFYYFNKMYSCANPSDIQICDSTLLLVGATLNDTIIADTITVFAKQNSFNCFISLYDIDGNVSWIKLFGGPNPYSIGNEFTSDLLKNHFATGTFTDTGYFQTDTLTNNGKTDAFLVKYDINGNEKWVRQLNSSGGSCGYNVTSDENGFCYITGNFSGTAQFGLYTLTSASNSDMFLARYDSLGNCLGVKSFGNGSGNGVTQDALGNPIVCGHFFQSTNIGSQTFNSYGDADVFIAKCDAITGNMENKPPNNQLLIYANPTQGKCNITIPDEFANDKQLTLTVYDNIGREIQVQTITMHEGKIKLNLTAEAKGMYHVSLSNGSKVYNGKIVFE